MRRLKHLCLLLLALALVSGCSTMGTALAWLNGQVVVSEAQLQNRLDRRFPRTFDSLGGLVSVTLANPQVSIPRGDSRLNLEFDLGVGALGGEGVPNGRLVLVSGLRYDPDTQGLHLDDPELLQFYIPGSGDLLESGARVIVNRVLADYARREPIYRLDDDLLARVPAGRSINAVGIERGAVVIRLSR